MHRLFEMRSKVRPWCKFRSDRNDRRCAALAVTHKNPAKISEFEGE